MSSTDSHPLPSTHAAPSPQPRREELVGRGLSLGSIGGVRIEVDWSLSIVFVLVLLNLGAGVFPAWHPDWSAALTWGVAFAAAFLFFCSVLMHELAHALVARTQGVEVNRITLFLFGGLAHMGSEPPSPRSEFLIAAVGPLTSFGLGLLALLVASRAMGPQLSFGGAQPTTIEEARALMEGVGPLATLLLWLGPINLLLGAFNLVPGFPLDGGRVLRSILWGISGDLLKATRWAANAGRLFAWLLMALGVMNMFGGMFGQGLWFLLIGWFLNTAAHMSHAQARARHALQDVPVSRVMWTDPTRVSPDMSLDQLVRDRIMTSNQIAFPVEREGAFVGLVVLDDVRRIPQTRWATTTVADVMTPPRELGVLAPAAGADRALEELARLDVDQLPVLEGSHLTGLVRRRDLLRWIALQEGKGPSGRPSW